MARKLDNLSRSSTSSLSSAPPPSHPPPRPQARPLTHVCTHAARTLQMSYTLEENQLTYFYGQLRNARGEPGARVKCALKKNADVFIDDIGVGKIIDLRPREDDHVFVQLDAEQDPAKRRVWVDLTKVRPLAMAGTPYERARLLRIIENDKAVVGLGLEPVVPAARVTARQRAPRAVLGAPQRASERLRSAAPTANATPAEGNPAEGNPAEPMEMEDVPMPDVPDPAPPNPAPPNPASPTGSFNLEAVQAIVEACLTKHEEKTAKMLDAKLVEHTAEVRREIQFCKEANAFETPTKEKESKAASRVNGFAWVKFDEAYDTEEGTTPTVKLTQEIVCGMLTPFIEVCTCLGTRQRAGCASRGELRVPR